jgi:2-(1,2-epoxy-1,2-dihydrophenyl)acetyl-CoA isomerase
MSEGMMVMSDPGRRYETLLWSVRDSVATITLNRPRVLNALSRTVTEELMRALDDAADRSVRCVVITGAGRAFCAGADLAPRAGDDPDLGVEEVSARWFAPVIERIVALQKPVLAAVNGVAAGGGISLALACDLRIAGDTARFPQVYIRRALVPDFGTSFFLPRIVGLAKALELTMLGEELSAQDALHIGMVTRVVAQESLAEHTRALAAALAAGPTRDYYFTRQALLSGATSPLATALRTEAALQAAAAETADFREGIDAFVGRRPPRFTGR